jgi:hypothetical protein
MTIFDLKEERKKRLFERQRENDVKDKRDDLKDILMI